MTITISPSLESEIREKAAAEGVPVDVYVERLIVDKLRDAAGGEGDWSEVEGNVLDESDPEFSEIHMAVMEGVEEVERGEGRPARTVFAELRAQHGLTG